MNKHMQKSEVRTQDTTTEQFEKGRLYKWTGAEFEVMELADVIKVPVTEEGMDAVKAIRKAMFGLTPGRPDLVIVATAMLLAAKELPDMAERAKAYGRTFYGE